MWEQKEGLNKKQAWKDTNLESMIWFLLCVCVCVRGSDACGQQTASFLPVRQHGDRKGHQRGSLGRQFASCQGRWGSRDKCIRVAEGATCVSVSHCLMLTSMTPRWVIEGVGDGCGSRREQRAAGWGSINVFPPFNKLADVCICVNLRTNHWKKYTHHIWPIFFWSFQSWQLRLLEI